ncbi:MAG: hypothetical protein IJX66_03600 [Lachnospiraceae bacterium]|nr:hypothetical protein [Lachnospiraceae bacterium]
MSKKTKKIGTFIVMTTMLAGLTACSQEAKFEKQLELGAESLNAGEYETAITAFETAITLNTSSLEGYAGLVAAMNLNDTDPEEIKELVKEVNDIIRKMSSSETGMTAEEIEMAEEFYMEAANAVSADAKAELEVLENGVEALGEETSIASVYVEKADELIQNYLSENKYEEAVAQAEKVAENVPSDIYAQELATVVTEKAQTEQELIDLMLAAIDIIEAEDWQSLADYTESDELAAIKERVGDAGSYIYLPDGGNTGMGIGYYSFEGCECDQWYYGYYVDGMRSGAGGWYWAANYSEGLYLETYYGEWSEDAPNGTGYKYYEYAGYVEECAVTVENGLLEGIYSHDFVDSKTGTVYTSYYEAVDGEYVEVEVEDWLKDDVPEGRYCYCIVYIDHGDGTESAQWLHTTYGAKYGISHFRE